MEDLLLYYIRCRVEERSPQSKLCMEQFYNGKLPNEFSEPTSLQRALIKKCKEIEKEHAQVFHGLVKSLQLGESLQDTLQLLMTEGRGMNYGRLVVLVSFSGYACSQLALVLSTSRFVAVLEKLYNFFKATISPWIYKHGGWKELRKFLCITEENSQTLSNLNIGGVFVLLYLLFC